MCLSSVIHMCTSTKVPKYSNSLIEQIREFKLRTPGTGGRGLEDQEDWGRVTFPTVWRQSLDLVLATKLLYKINKNKNTSNSKRWLWFVILVYGLKYKKVFVTSFGNLVDKDDTGCFFLLVPPKKFKYWNPLWKYLNILHPDFETCPTPTDIF